MMQRQAANMWRAKKAPTKKKTNCVSVIAALQSPIEYQKEKSGAGSSSSLTRNRSASGNRPASSSHSSRPSSAVGLGDKEAERGRSQMKVSTSNGGPSCFDSRVRSLRLSTAVSFVS